MKPETAETNLLGKKASDLQTNIAVSGTEITGTLKYVTDYTGFHGSNPVEQEGNYLALHATAEPSGATITVELIGGTSGKGPVKLDPDGIIVLRITNKTSQKVKVTATKDKTVKTITYGLTGLTLTPKTA